MKPKTYICGHKNPDSDSICSAYSLAYLKNHTEEGEHVPIRCGPMNPQTKFIFERMGIDPPGLKSDLYPKVRETMRHNPFVLDINAPITDAVESMCVGGLRFIPLTEKKRYCGFIGFTEIGQFLLRSGLDDYHFYNLNINNLCRVLRAQTVHSGIDSEFTAAFLVGGMGDERSETAISRMEPSRTTLVVSDRPQLINEAIRAQLRCIIITGQHKSRDFSAFIDSLDLSGYNGWVLLTSLHTEEALRKAALSVPVRELMTRDIVTLSEEARLDEATRALRHRHSVPVIDSEENIVGIINGNDIIESAPKQLIMVDHNELDQAINGAELCEIREIIDHHRIAPPPSKKPIVFTARPIGSTCTLVYEMYQQQQVKIPQDVARILLSGILSDTVILKSPTTTESDRLAVFALEQIAEFNHLDLGREIFEKGRMSRSGDAKQIIATDFKRYEHNGVRVGIGQVEVTTPDELDEMEAELVKALSDTRESLGMEWAMLLVTDIIRGNSALMTSDYPPGEMNLGFSNISEHRYYLPGILSRKKQLLPAIIEAIDQI